MDSSILFSGVHFDRRRFAADIQKFKRKNNVESDLQQRESFENSDVLNANGDTLGTTQKSSRTPSSSQSMQCGLGEGFKESYVDSKLNSKDPASLQKRKRKALNGPMNLFKATQNAAELSQIEHNEELKVKQKQEQSRKSELAAFLRKQHRIHVAGHDSPCPLSSFKELKSLYGCKSYLVNNIVQAGYKEPTPVQRQAIPVLLSGRECFACAPTGSGKTLAFIIPILMKLKVPSKDGIRAVVLCPTRELAKQITEEFKKLAKGKKFRIRLMTKSLSRCGDFRSLPCDILISTPLRLDFLLDQSKIDLSRVEYLVLDESDKLFELGFVEQIDAVVNACTNPLVLRSLFSATLPDSVEELARSIMHDAVRVVIGEKNSASQTILQRLLFVGSEEGKLLAVRQLFQESLQPPILLFVQSKERAKDLHRELAFEDVKVDSIHADLTQAQREQAVERFREGKTWVLIATDLMSRGMDFKGVNVVINFDFPNTTASYIHRIGRSGRAGRPGQAITFYTEDDVPLLRSIVNVVVASGCDVPSWMLSLPKNKRKRHNPKRERISVRPFSQKRKHRHVSKLPAKTKSRD